MIGTGFAYHFSKRVGDSRRICGRIPVTLSEPPAGVSLEAISRPKRSALTSCQSPHR